MEYTVKKDGDITVFLNEIQINNIKKWNKTSGKDFFNNVGDSASKKPKMQRQGTTAASMIDEDDRQIIKTKVSITYYRLYEFAKLFNMNKIKM